MISLNYKLCYVLPCSDHDSKCYEIPKIQIMEYFIYRELIKFYFPLIGCDFRLGVL